MNQFTPEPIFHSERKLDFTAFVCILNLLCMLPGYEFAASFSTLLGFSNSQTISIPYRIFSLAVLFSACGLCLLKEIPREKITTPMYIMFGCCVAYILKVFVNIVNEPFFLDTTRTWFFTLYAFFSAISIWITFNKIDFKKALPLILLMLAFVCMLKPLGFSHTADTDLLIDISRQRQSVAVGMNSISFGFAGASLCLLSLALIFNKRIKFIWKIPAAVGVVLGFYITVFSGSRSPIVVLLICTIIFFASFFKNFVLALAGVGLLGGLAYICKHAIVSVIATVSQFAANRMEALIEDTGNNPHTIIAMAGWDKFKSSPILGTPTIDFTLTVSPLTGYHTAIIDALALFGIIGGAFFIWIIAYAGLKTFYIIRHKELYPEYWVALFAMLYLLYDIIAGGLFTIRTKDATLMMIVLVIISKTKRLFGPNA